jgi:hypothetical protein
MTGGTTTLLDGILSGFMGSYKANVHEVDAITRAMIAEMIFKGPEHIENDHIAFRTLGVPNLGIASLEKIFLHLGYLRRRVNDFKAFF